MANFMFATGIENSIPTINNGRTRVDQMEACGHYRQWQTDFDLVEDLGIRYLRFGPPLHKTFLAPGRYDWEFADLTLRDLNRLKQHCILGNDYYWTNEHRVHADGSTCASGEVFGYTEITRQYYGRYGLPVMHTETNLREGPNGDEAVNWLWKEWASVLRLRNIGIPTVGFTWYSLTDQVDWDTALREQNGNVNALGLYDLDRNIRRVGSAYKQLIRDWHDVLPAQSVCLVVPLVTPAHAHRVEAVEQQRRLESLDTKASAQPSSVTDFGR